MGDRRVACESSAGSIDITPPRKSLRTLGLPGPRPKSRYLCPVAAQQRTAPASAVGLGTVIEPQHALRAFAMMNQIKVCMRKQFRYRLRNRRQILFNRLLAVYALVVKIASRLRAENAMTDGVFEENIQFVQWRCLFCLLRHYRFQGDFPQAACLSQERALCPFHARQGLSQSFPDNPGGNIFIALPGVGQFIPDHMQGIDEVERGMIAHKIDGRSNLLLLQYSSLHLSPWNDVTLLAPYTGYSNFSRVTDKQSVCGYTRWSKNVLERLFPAGQRFRSARRTSGVRTRACRQIDCSWIGCSWLDCSWLDWRWR